MNAEQTEQFFNHILSHLNENRYPKLYEYLECSTDCSQSVIKEQYRSLSLIHHPDRGGSTSRMIQINEAYDILSNPEKRNLYDTFGTSSVIDFITYYHSSIPKYIYEIFPIVLNSYINYFLNLKDLTIKYAVNYTKSDYKKLNVFYILLFPLVHHFVENNVSKLLDKFDNRKGKKEDGNEDGNKRFVKNLISEVVATFLSAPFEVICYFIFTNKPESEYRFETVTKAFHSSSSEIIKQSSKYLGSATTSKFFVGRFIREIVPFCKTYLSIFKHWKLILTVVGFRIGYTLFFQSLSAASNYFDEKSKLNLNHYNDRCQNKVVNVENELNDRLLNNQQQQQEQENQEYNDDEMNNQHEIIKEIELIGDQVDKEYEQESRNIYNRYQDYHVYSKLLAFASYTLPSLFSIHRMFYKIERPSISYFSGSLLKSCVFDSFTYFTYDYTFGALSRVSVSLQYSVFKLLDSLSNKIKENTNKNNKNK